MLWCKACHTELTARRRQAGTAACKADAEMTEAELDALIARQLANKPSWWHKENDHDESKRPELRSR